MDINAPILQQIKNAVRTTDPEAMLILFGSFARGDNRHDSDIDILVLLDKEKITYADRRRIGDPIHHIELTEEIMISPIIFSKKTWETKFKITPLYKNVATEGILL